MKEVIIKVLGDHKWEEKIGVHFYNSDWELMANVITVLKGFMEATEINQSSYSSCHHY